MTPDEPPRSRTADDEDDLAAAPTEGRAAPPRIDSIGRRLLESRLLSVLVGEDEGEAVRVDRFVLRRELGSGGMGTIYEAWDEQLQRRIALKFLRNLVREGVGDPAAEQRLFREAQGLAQLSHPNVVPVYDVGRHEGRVWLAMEYVPGQTLRQWAKQAPRGRAEILETWIAAGRGLAAIHAAGLVHRDIKPDNIMRGEDGRVRVVDFGLVRAVDGIDERLQSGGPPTVRDELGRPLTAADSFVGTPAYAAPEQLDGRAVDPRSDQFSYCVALWEALCGVRPKALRDGALAPLPEGARLPGTLHRALSRGLATDPARRFPSIDALLDHIAPRSRRRWPELAAALTLATLGGMWLRSELADPPAEASDPCAEAAAPIERAWGFGPRLGVAERIASTGADPLLPALDDWARDWGDAARESCEDVHVRQRLSAESLDRRAACLGRRLAAFEVVTQSIANAEGADRGERIAALSQLGDPGTCLAEAVLVSEVSALPENRAEAVAELRRALVQLELDRGTRGVSERIAAAEHVLTRARALDWRPLVGEASLVVGRLHTAAGDGPAARASLGEALDIAEATRDLEQQAHVWSALNQVERLVELDVERARWAVRRHAALLRQTDPSPRQRARLLTDQGQTHELDGEIDQAERSLREALALLEDEGLVVAWDRASVLHGLANVLAHHGRAAEARELFARARDLELGPSSDELRPGQRSPSSLSVRFDEGLAMLVDGAHEAAAARLQQILIDATREHGPRSEMVARVHVALAATYDYLGQPAQVRHHAELADQISLEALGPDHPLRTDVLSAVGVAATHEGRTRDAVRAFEWALRIMRRIKPADSLEVAEAEHNLASALVDAGEPTRADDLWSHAIPILARELGEDDPLLADARDSQAKIRTNQGEVTQ